MSDAVAPDLGDLCTACGMCCDGTLFDWVNLDPGELDDVSRLGLPVETVDGKTGFRQPCPRLSGSRCTVYAGRPGKCRKYECTTLAQLRKGEIAREEAQRRVASALTAAARVRAEFLPGENIADARERRRAAIADPGRAPATPQFMLLLGVLDLQLDRFFRSRKQRQLNLETDSPTSPEPGGS
jgi:uncharacterized protein